MNLRRGFFFLISLLLVMLLVATGCKATVVTAGDGSGSAGGSGSVQGPDLTAAQKLAVKQEAEGIENFIKRTGWPMQQTPTGLWVEVYERAGAGSPQVEYGNAVKISYTLTLLNGSVVESCGEGSGIAPRAYILGESEVQPGLLEGLMLLHKGDKARLLIPSHLAYGFSGDGEKIPPSATLLYDLKVEEVLIRPQF